MQQRIATGEVDRPATAEALQGVTEFVRRGIGIEAVLRGIRLGQAEMTRGFLKACEQLVAPEDRLYEMGRMSEELFEYIDALAASMTEQYVQEQIRWSTSELAARRDLVTAVLRDGPLDTGAVSRRLGFSLSGPSEAFVLWTDAVGADVDTAGLQNAALQVLRRLPVRQHLVVPVSAGTIWAWVQADVRVDDQLRTAAATLPSHLYLAAGRMDHGVEGFRRSHQQASAAAHLVQTTGGFGSVVLYEEVELLSLLLQDHDRAVEFAAGTLGALWKDGPSSTPLRRTLQVYLEEQGSTQAAARRLHLARNTVAYRVQRAQEAMGGPIAGRTQEVHAALLIADAVASRSAGPSIRRAE